MGVLDSVLRLAATNQLQAYKVPNWPTKKQTLTLLDIKNAKCVATALINLVKDMPTS